MWVGRLRETLLLVVVWAIVVGLGLLAIAAVCGLFLSVWPNPSPLFLGALGILLAWGLVRFLLTDPLGRFRKAITQKYYAKIRDAEAEEAKDPWKRPPPFRLDPETASAGIGLGLGGLTKAITGAGLSVIRLLAPNLRIWPLPIRLVTRYSDVQAVLAAADTFPTVYGAEMRDLGEGADFVLGLNGAAHAPARKLLDDVVGELANPQDRDRVATHAAEVANALVDQSQGRMDVVADLIRRTAAEVCIEYFGFEAPDPDGLADWTIGMSRLLFSDPFGAPETREQAVQAASLFRGMVRRSLEVGERRPSRDTLVTRLLAQEAAGRITRPEIVAFLTGNAAGMIPTTTIGMTAIIELLLARPLWWDRARRLAAQIRGAGPAGDPAARKQLLDILMEAARLSPTLYPGQFRLAGRDAVIAPGTLRASRVRQGDLLMVSTASALQDGRRFKWPGAFNPDRPTAEKQAAELMFGAGVHKCVGIHLAKAVMLEIAVALFSREDLAPAPGDAGKVRSVGPFPRHKEMTWRPDGPVAGQSLLVIAAPLPAGANAKALAKGLEALRVQGGGRDMDRTGVVHFAAFSVLDLGFEATPQPWLVGELNVDGEGPTAIDRTAACLEDWLGLFQIVDPKLRTTDDLARFLKAHVLDIRCTPWGATGLQYPGAIGVPAGDIRRQKDLADYVREVLDHLNAHGAPEGRDSVRPAGGPPDAVQTLDTVRRLIRRDPDLVKASAKDPRLAALVLKGAAFRDFLLRPLGPRLAFTDFTSPPGSENPPLVTVLGQVLKDRNRGAVLAVVLALAVAVTAMVRIYLGPGGVADDLGGIVEIVFTSLVWVLAAYILALLAAVGLFVALLLAHEAADRADPSPPSPEAVANVEAFENPEGYAQNHMISVTRLKPGPFRRYTLALGMWVIRLLALFSFRQGNLARMGTIHFARWVKPPGTDALLFMSNYDGSWLSYLEDFTALASLGLNAAWGHSRGVPTATLMFLGGASDSDAFKRFAKRSLRRTNFWYSAYPGVTLENIRRNALIHDGLMRAANATEAQDWLDMLASVKRPELEIQTDEVQTLILRGLGSLPAMACGLIHIPPGADLAGWTAHLSRTVAFGNADPDPHRWNQRLWARVFHQEEGPFPDRPGEVGFVGFTASGLVKLGLPGPDTGVGLAGLLAPFYQGMSSRERVLRDAGPSAPANWSWSDSAWTGLPPDSAGVDAVLLVYGMTPGDCSAAIGAQAADFGLTLRKTLSSPARPVLPGGLRAEPFGFADGISNPAIRGLRGDPGLAGDQVEPGEILLGYPHNRDGRVPTCALPAELDPLDILPAVSNSRFRRYPAFGLESGAGADHDFGRNGTFLVVRQLEQDVAGFQDYTARTAAQLALTPGMAGVDPHWVGARMIGRWKDGSPVVLYPDASPHRPNPTNDFGYATLDPRGFACPLGSHVRRSNPRDSLMSDNLKAPNHVSSHRILRRGRAYLEPAPAGANPTEGLIFLAACTDLERQFEFIQQSWLGEPSFHGLTGEADPAVDSDGKLQDLSLPDGRTVRRIRGIPDFVTVRGGGYFFMPSRSALYYLADRTRRLAGPLSPPSATASRKRSASPSRRGEPA
ncbi:cytochrome P450 [Phenylobacterium sp.]|uniref:cytochrome P450 n=1 Tax=Phenylobacterium sp. TaxID=1871053 RepID=UPI002600EE67|nr:cytochrome P450 [Phenylobacterium sp.]MCA6324306.1 cytochrome P450 [Phenylobacterium sp.]MCA6355239.1 cytochrome P450 [Phenylobacterium sp.]MCA6360420.1 cytochrome P450 [Phenylobacterium sp.]